MKKIFLIVACALLALSCSKERVDATGDKKIQNPDYTAEHSYMRALGVAELAPKMFGAEDTKSEFRIVKKGIPVISDRITKSGASDTLMYIFNYEGDNGYTIVPKDERKGFVLAYADNGNFNIADTAVNSIVRYEIRNIIDYCEAPVNEEMIETKDAIGDLEFKKYGKVLKPYRGNGCRALRPVDSYDFDMPGPLGPPDSYYETTGCTAKLDIIYLGLEGVEPLVTTRWGQDFPYNLKAPVIDGKNAKTGCVATAAAQIIAYHSFPEKYPTGTYVDGAYYGDTDTKLGNLRNYKGGTGSANPGPGVRDYVSRLFRVIGDQVGMKWGVDESAAMTTYLPMVFRWFGYTNAPYMENYSIERLKVSLDAGYPLIISGTDTSVANGDGHAFIIDGYKYMYPGYVYCYFDEHGTFFKRDEFISPNGDTQLYVHINFGWNGSQDGYYLNGVFDTSDRDHRFETKSNYNGGLLIMPFIHP